jgi:hypothetical protein
MFLTGALATGSANADSVADGMTGALDRVRSIATIYELRTLQTAVQIEVIFDNMRYVKKDFSGFVRTIAHSDNKDVAKDHWGSFYSLENCDRGYRVVSAGPDRIVGNKDDLVRTIRMF